jgi:hypothetical protein
MEEIMIETNVDPKIILGKVQRKMDNLTIEIKEHQPRRMLKNEDSVGESSRVLSLM